MPAAKGGESKQGLVVTLVFFILVSIILGVLTYMGFDGQGALLEAKKKAEDGEKNAKEDRNYYKAQALLFRSQIGYAPKDADSLNALATGHDDLKSKKLGAKATDSAEVGKVVDDLEKDLGWNAQTKKPAINYLTRIEDLKKQLQEKEEAKNQAEQRRNELANALKREQNKNKELKDFFDGELAKVNAARKKDAEESQKLTDKQRTDFGDAGKVLGDKQVEFDDQKKAMQKEIDKQKKEIADLKKLVVKINDKLAPLDPADFSGPKGKVVLIDKTGTMPYINIGTADNVRPQLTFSIHGVGPDGRPIKESKGSLEVISVVNEHLSKCKVTSVVDAYRAPVVKGDVIMNAAWDPSMKKHVAIVGVIDLTGESRDDRPAEQMRQLREFKRILENQNMVVDAYLDLEDLSVKGPGISRQTDYLIHGSEPINPLKGEVKGDGKKSPRDELLTAMEKMRKEATVNGVTIIELKKFLTMTGYKVPRAPNGRDTQIHGSLPQAGSPVDKTK
jgi:hypothetical protein